ncbi:RagB/SusD family nutrient uptake outer membrane protein [Membranihabitans maritimus]|uniref:RagB/SusD family nutrient uptake outer membrane protein n=1 Tax=Membranihabitans maritimus TaxID=2904244 RepID=UPI001F1F88EA|nr:RagB/SusD family nutrient uptake outer membrane protein [Membranihabitans maritimus]
MRIKTYSLLIVLVAILNACIDLDREVVTTLQEDQVTESFEFTKNRINAVYEGLQSGFNPIGDAMSSSATDDAEFTIESSSVQRFNTGNWNALSNPDDKWYHYYRAIFNANRFLETSDNVDLDVYRLDPSPSAQKVFANRLIEIERWKAEAIFLRAYFYFELVKRYGGVPILTRTYEAAEDYKDIQRATLDECISFITAQCDIAASRLPGEGDYSLSQLGRATSGAALALKSRVLLYAASDLFNDPSWSTGFVRPDLIASQNGQRREKWRAAADAAKEVIDLSEYSLDSDYEELFHTFNSSEIILARREGSSNYFERINYPIGYDLGRSGNTPSQNLVDVYEMADGSSFDWGNPDHALNPYENRDPRLQYTVVTNGEVFRERPVELWTGGRDGQGTERASRTGYYLQKYVNGDLNLLQDETSVHTWILIRLGEIYLNYAEALNECDPGNPDIKEYVDAVRGRSGVEMPPLPEGLSQEQMRERIRNERRVELAFEGYRFWDVRRWMKGAEYFGNPLQGVEVIRRDSAVYDYTPLVVEDRVWNQGMYLYPIPESEILQMSGWEQNPGW